MADILTGKIFSTWRLTFGTWGPAIPGPGKGSLGVFFNIFLVFKVTNAILNEKCSSCNVVV